MDIAFSQLIEQQNKVSQLFKDCNTLTHQLNVIKRYGLSRDMYALLDEDGEFTKFLNSNSYNNISLESYSRDRKSVV